MSCCISEVLPQPHPAHGNTPNYHLPWQGLGGWVTVVSLEREEMEQKEISMFTTSYLFTMLRRTSSRFVPAAGRVFVLLLQARFSSPSLAPAPRAERAESLPCPGSGLAGCLCRGCMVAAPLLAPAVQSPRADPPEDNAAETDVTSSH